MAQQNITHLDIIMAAAHQLDEDAETLDLIAQVKGGVPDLASYYRSQLQAERDNLRELASTMRHDAEAVEA